VVERKKTGQSNGHQQQMTFGSTPQFEQLPLNDCDSLDCLEQFCKSLKFNNLS
jgi:hypothetical protein